MPARSKAQRQAMAIAEHHPEQLYARNKGMLGMSHQQLHDFAATTEKGKPEHVSSNPGHGKRPNAAGSSVPHPHRNLGKYLHPKKG